MTINTEAIDTDVLDIMTTDAEATYAAEDYLDAVEDHLAAAGRAALVFVHVATADEQQAMAVLNAVRNAEDQACYASGFYIAARMSDLTPAVEAVTD